MARLIDELRAGGKLGCPHFVLGCNEQAWTQLAAKLHTMLCQPDLPVLVIDNVADYYFSGTDQEHWDLTRDFPNLAPPYPALWIEHRIPKQIRSRECGTTDVSRWVTQGRVGAFLYAIDRPDANGEGIPENAKWILWCELYIDYGIDRKVIATGPHGSTFLCVDEHGVMIDRPWMQSFAGDEDADVMKSFMSWFHPMLLAVSFLHCKNVRIEDQAVPRPLAKKWHGKTGCWPSDYKTLVIEPLKQILRHEGGSDRHGLAKAMHICRGHFKDYREGRGLFGKYHQLVWQPSLVRGTRGHQAPPRQIEVRV